MSRTETRKQRYDRKVRGAKTMPISVATVNFGREANVAYVFRAAACFGAEEVHVMGTVLDRETMNDLSGSTYDYVPAFFHPTPVKFIEHCEKEKINIIAFEMPGEIYSSIPVGEFEFDFSKRNCIVVGHETSGVPVEILARAQRVYIPMPGLGYCLNTSQAANIALYEASKRYFKSHPSQEHRYDI